MRPWVTLLPGATGMPRSDVPFSAMSSMLLWLRLRMGGAGSSPWNERVGAMGILPSTLSEAIDWARGFMSGLACMGSARYEAEPRRGMSARGRFWRAWTTPGACTEPGWV